MGFKRANWHSGLTYKQVCEECKQVMVYTDHQLDFRPWYPDGFVYCSRCQTPLRHNEAYALQNTPENVSTADSSDTSRALFCTSCGRKYAETDNFCGGCGKKR